MSDLAICGGVPVRSSMLPYGRQAIDEADIAAVVRVLRSDWLTTGPEVAAFEAAFASRVGAKFCVAVANGTAALHIAALAAGFRPGDEVIVPSLTFAASANCVRYVGADVVFSDVDDRTLNLHPQAAERAITAATKGIVAVDYAGLPGDMAEILALAREHSLLVIEDASHALGAVYRGKRVGSLADMTVFSLHPVKHITTGEGGVVTTDDERLAHLLRLYRNHGITADHRQRLVAGSWVYDVSRLGFNYRLTDFQCALGRSQLSKLDGFVARRREIADRYSREMGDFPLLDTPSTPPDRDSSWHLYVIRLNLDRLKVDRAQVFAALRAENIGVNVHYIPVPWHSYYQRAGYRKGAWPVAEAEYMRLLSLPIFPSMSDDDVDDVVAAVMKVLCYYAA